MISWYKKNKELLLPLVGVAVFFGFLAFLGLYFQGSSAKKDAAKEEEIKIFKKVDITPQKNEANEEIADSDTSQNKPESNAFFLKPSAAEILDVMEGLTPVELDEKTHDFPGLKVMWPLYFFQIVGIEELDPKILLDVSEDGFGVSVLCDVDMAKYPQIENTEVGELLWIAGEIIGVDPEGTGQILIKTEQIRFGGTLDAPPTATVFAEEEDVVVEPSGEVIVPANEEDKG